MEKNQGGVGVNDGHPGLLFEDDEMGDVGGDFHLGMGNDLHLSILIKENLQLANVFF